jgi:hypothetical protein
MARAAANAELDDTIEGPINSSWKEALLEITRAADFLTAT